MLEPVFNDPSLPACVVCDVDGTLAPRGERSPYDYSLVHKDIPNRPVVEAVRALKAAGNHVVLFSGRDDSCRDATAKWLDEHGVPWDELHMRVTGDKRADKIIKYELIQRVIAGKWHITCWLDDRDQVVDMVRAVIPDEPTLCFRVNYGDF